MDHETAIAPVIQSPVKTQWLSVTVSGIQEEKVPPRLAFYTLFTRRDGKKKHCPSTALITDTNLLQRLREEVKSGDQIRVYIETDWAAEGIPTVLKDFCRV